MLSPTVSETLINEPGQAAVLAGPNPGRSISLSVECLEGLRQPPRPVRQPHPRPRPRSRRSRSQPTEVAGRFGTASAGFLGDLGRGAFAVTMMDGFGMVVRWGVRPALGKGSRMIRGTVAGGCGTQLWSANPRRSRAQVFDIATRRGKHQIHLWAGLGL